MINRHCTFVELNSIYSCHPKCPTMINIMCFNLAQFTADADETGSLQVVYIKLRFCYLLGDLEKRLSI